MDHRQSEHIDAELDSLLRRNRPAPNASWARTFEQRTFAERRPGLWRIPQVRIGAALAAGLAVCLFALALVGVGPLGDGPADVRAREDCKLVRATVVERVPHLQTGSDGQPRLAYTRERVERFVRRCP